MLQIVRPHDDASERFQKKFSPCDVENQSTSVKHAESYDTADTILVDGNSFPDHSDRECPICMERFVVGDIVSWSSYDKCSHVYHHQCIKEWLLRHNNCPFCREVFLPVDNVRVQITMKIFKELSELRARRAETTYYCIQDGLVTLEDRSGNIHNRTCTTLNAGTPPRLRSCGRIKGGEAVHLKEKLKAGVTKADLRKLRGSRCEKICYEEAPVPEIIENQEIERSSLEDPDVGLHSIMVESDRPGQHHVSFESDESSTVASNEPDVPRETDSSEGSNYNKSNTAQNADEDNDHQAKNSTVDATGIVLGAECTEDIYGEDPAKSSDGDTCKAKSVIALDIIWQKPANGEETWGGREALDENITLSPATDVPSIGLRGLEPPGQVMDDDAALLQEKRHSVAACQSSVQGLEACNGTFEADTEESAMIFGGNEISLLRRPSVDNNEISPSLMRRPSVNNSLLDVLALHSDHDGGDSSRAHGSRRDSVARDAPRRMASF